MLSGENLDVVYDEVMLALSGVSFEIRAGTIVALLGANGAGKTTLLRAVSGLLGVHEGSIKKGAVTLDGEPIHELSASEIGRRGLKQVMEGRRIFAELSVEENLRVGAYVASKDAVSSNLDRVLDLFPVLQDRRRMTAGYLSGGQQQMLAMGMALMSGPRYLLLDEPSLGLAPQLVEQIRDLIVQINKQGTTVLLIEQNATMALSIADHGYVLENGKIVMDKPAKELLTDDDIREFYLGFGVEGGTKSFQDVKHYKRRKRWLS